MLLLRAGSALFETVHMTRDGHRIPVEVSARLIDVGGASLCLSVARDIAARKELEGLLRSMSHQDELTGLLNRRGFFTMVEHESRRARRLGAKAVLLYADLDGLKAGQRSRSAMPPATRCCWPPATPCGRPSATRTWWRARRRRIRRPRRTRPRRRRSPRRGDDRGAASKRPSTTKRAELGERLRLLD